MKAIDERLRVVPVSRVVNWCSQSPLSFYRSNLLITCS
jgi:hypothetical protein